MNQKPSRAMRVTALFAMLLSAATLVGTLFCTNALAEETTTSGESSSLEFTKVDQIIGKKLGVLNGGAFDILVLQYYPDASQDDILYFNSNAETLQALKTGKVDAMITDLPIAQLAVSKNEGIGVMPEYLIEDHYGYILQKDSPLTAQLNERLAAYREDGTIQKLYDKWTGSDDSVKTVPPQDWESPNGTLTTVANADSEPMAYQKGNDAVGMTVELLCLMARDLGYGVTFKTAAAGTLIPEVQSGKADIATSCFSITDERKQMVDMTDPYYDGGLVAVVRDTASGGTGSANFFDELIGSFNRTFLIEDRWQLILSGLGVTLIISVASGAAGLMLGFVFVLLRRKKADGIAEKLISLLENVLGGLPVVVVLMVFYYIFFGSIDIPGVLVAVLAFSLLFGASTGTIMWNAIRAVDAGQAEAGRALGFGDRDTFLLVVLPQAARQFAPLLLGQFVSLIKDTSIVGYIAVQDLTRVGDLIRARTMEAFFPLIAIAIIYFAICRLMAWALSKLIKKLEPKDGPRTIKGVEL